jgi:hypothetical protein
LWVAAMTRTAIGLAEPPESREAELSRLRELLWLRLAIGAYRERSLNDHLIEQFREVGRQLANEGTRTQRRKEWRSWGKWLTSVGRRLRDYASEVEMVR